MDPYPAPYGGGGDLVKLSWTGNIEYLAAGNSVSVREINTKFG